MLTVVNLSRRGKRVRAFSSPTSQARRPAGHRTQAAEDRPVSSINWHTTVKDLLAQGMRDLVLRDLVSHVRIFSTCVEASVLPTHSGQP